MKFYLNWWLLNEPFFVVVGCWWINAQKLLAPVKLGAVKKYVFKLYPAGGQGQADAQWRMHRRH